MEMLQSYDKPSKWCVSFVIYRIYFNLDIIISSWSETLYFLIQCWPDLTLTLTLQLSELEKQQILEFEGHLAAANKVTITEQNSLLISQLMAMDPR